MAELVDAIVADLTVKYEQYVAGFDKATEAHARFTRSIPKIGAMGGFTQAEAQQYADRHTKVGEAAEKSGEKRKRAAKGASDAEKAEAKAAADAVKKAAREREQAERAAARATEAAVKAAEREKQAALKATQREQEKAARAAAAKAEAERAAAAAAVAAAEREAAAQARLAAVAERAAARRGAGLAPAVGGRIGTTVPRESTGQVSIPLNVLSGSARAEAEGEREINHLLADQAVLSSRLVGLRGRERDAVRDQLSELRLVRQLERAGLDDAAIALRLDERRTLVARQRAAAERAQSSRGAEQFARGAGLSAATGGGAALAGIATAAGVAVGVEVVRSAVEYGKALDDLSKQLGITTGDLQAYLKIARDTGVEQATLSSAFGQFASNLGRAQQGGEEQKKVFDALGISIKGFASAGDALPSVIDRISQIKDPLQRAAVEARLFGEEGRKLDPLLSGGAAAVSNLAASLQETGRALSAKEIQELDETGRKLADVNNQLQVDFARIVAGNADAIIGLANSFGALASKVLEAIGRIQQFNDQRALIAPDILAGAEDKAQARRNLLSTQSGRQALFTDNTNRANAIIRKYRLGPNDETLLAAQAPGSPRKTVAQFKREQRAAELAPILKERAEIRAANNQNPTVPTPPVQTGAVNTGLLSNLGAPKPPKGKSAEQQEREAEQRTRQFNDQLAQAQADFLRAQEQMTGSADKRAEIELSLLDNATKTRLADIESQRKRNVLAGADAVLEAARASELAAAERKADAEQRSLIEQDRRFAKEQALTTATQSLLDARATVLSAELSLARTTAERRRIQLALVDNQEAQDRSRLQGIINSSPADSDASRQARTDLGRVGDQVEQQRRVVRDQNLDPLDQYKRDLHSATDDTNAAIQSIKVNALQSLEDSLTRSMGKVLGLKGAFGDLVGSVLSDIARLELKKGILRLLGDSGGSGGTGSIIGSIAHAAGIGGARASGGNVVGGVPYLVGERGPEILTMGASGRVYPNGALPSIARGGWAGQTTVHQYFNLDARYGITTTELLDHVNQVAKAESTRAAGASFVAGQRAAPGTYAQYQNLEG